MQDLVLDTLTSLDGELHRLRDLFGARFSGAGESFDPSENELPLATHTRRPSCDEHCKWLAPDSTTNCMHPYGK